MLATRTRPTRRKRRRRPPPPPREGELWLMLDGQELIGFLVTTREERCRPPRPIACVKLWEGLPRAADGVVAPAFFRSVLTFDQWCREQREARRPLAGAESFASPRAAGSPSHQRRGVRVLLQERAAAVARSVRAAPRAAAGGSEVASRPGTCGRMGTRCCLG